MKKIISTFLSVTILFSCLFSVSTCYAEDKLHVENALLQLEAQTGYVPGQTSSVTYNCFGFVSDICEKLYGVSYYYEQQDGNYKFRHTSNYYTVSEAIMPYTSDANVRKSYASQLCDWLKSNVAVGDILQYGSADPSYSKKHTVLIQHIDDEKIQFIHSNYETGNIPASACRVDTIYWNSFISNPMANQYDSNGNIVSLNYLFGSNMKLTQGMGLSINRYSFLETKYYLDTFSRYTPTITKTERMSCSSIKVYWKPIDGVAAYSLEYRRQDCPDWTVASYSIATTDYTVKNLEIGSTYCFRLRAFAEGVWKDYSAEAVKSALPPKPSNITVTQSSEGINITWATRKDISGCIIYRSDSKNGAYYPIATITDISQTGYVDTAISCNTEYFYKIQRFVNVNGAAVYSEMSDAKSGRFFVGVPDGVFSWSVSKKELGVTWKAVPNAVSYTVICRQTSSGSAKYITTSELTCTVKGLTLGKKYKVSVIANSIFGQSAEGSAYSITLKPKTPTASASKSGKAVKVKWQKQSGVTGYYIYRADSKKGKYKLIKTAKGSKATSYKDNSASSKHTHYYKVKSYVKRGKTVYKSNASPVAVYKKR